MKQNLHIITLSVSNFARSYKFYTQILGWKITSTDDGEIAFFQTSGVVFAIYPREKLAEDAQVSHEGNCPRLRPRFPEKLIKDFDCGLKQKNFRNLKDFGSFKFEISAHLPAPPSRLF